uniref:NADH:quinone oxidoreductase/Mrp antiporter transmembrane domain-containing protein n=1 Tax=candidate division WOR-3 bacterium TaxID=2052148 RepID=A0A7V3V0D8_UNCW3
MSFGNWLSFGGGNLELYLALIFGFIGLMALLYSFARIKGTVREVIEYYIFVLLLILAGIALVFARNLLVIFVLWELATVAVWRLVSYLRKREAVDAGLWAFYINFAAATVMLVGLVMIQIELGTLELRRLAGQSLPLFPALLVLVGIIAKSAALPLYIWLPRAYRHAPAPICALLSGLAENLGLVLFLKLFVFNLRVPDSFYLISAILGVVSSLVAGGVALNAKTIRETLAYSTVSQLGFILLAISMRGYYGIVSGLLYILAHAVAKSGLFFAAGAVEEDAGTDELNRLGGWAKVSPTLAGATGVLTLSIMGLPPTVGFFAKFGVVLAAVRENLLYGIGALVGALFTVLYLSRFYTRIFLGTNQLREVKKISKMAIALVIVMAVITIAAGVLWFVPVRFFEGGL